MRARGAVHSVVWNLVLPFLGLLVCREVVLVSAPRERWLFVGMGLAGMVGAGVWLMASFVRCSKRQEAAERGDVRRGGGAS